MKKLMIAALAFFLMCSGSNLAAQQTDFKFRVGIGEMQSGYISLDSTSVFSEKTGYGFDLGSTIMMEPSRGKKRNKPTTITANKPFFFSVNVPEGNYKVTITAGSNKAATTLTVKAESRRLMLEQIVTKPGEFITRTFVVNVRRPEIMDGNKVTLTRSEVGSLDWDNKLTLEFNGAKPSISAINITKDDKQVTVYLAGNSTVVDQRKEPWAAWGQMITRFFKPGVAIANHAESGLTLATFKSQNRLDKVLSLINLGDYLFIEFGHNDQKMAGPDDGAWKSYTENLKYFIREVKKKQAYAVVVSSTSRRNFDENRKTINTLGDFPTAARKVAEDEHVPFIDLNAMTAELYDALGVDNSKKAFVYYPANTYPAQKKALADDTHFNAYGAYEVAKCVIEGIRKNQLGLVKFLVDSPVFDPKHPDAPEKFNLPPTPGAEIVKPDGN